MNFLSPKVILIITENNKRLNVELVIKVADLNRIIDSVRCGIEYNKSKFPHLDFFFILLGTNPKELGDCEVFSLFSSYRNCSIILRSELCVSQFSKSLTSSYSGNIYDSLDLLQVWYKSPHL